MKTVKQFGIVMTLMVAVLLSLPLPALAINEVAQGVQAEQTAYGAQSTPSRLLAQTEPRQPIFPLPDASRFGDIPAPNTQASAQQQFGQLVLGLVQNARFIIGAIAIVMIIYAGLRMITGWGKDDAYATQRLNIFYAIVGLAVVAMAGDLITIFQVACPDPAQPDQPCTPGGILSNPDAILRTAVLFDQRTQIIITFIKYLIGSVAVLMIVRNTLRLITMSSAEEKVELDKKNLAYSALGLGLIIIADTIISQVIYKVDLSRYPTTGGAQPAIDAVRGVQEIVGFTNFIVTLVGPLAILALLAGGVLYMTAGGDEERTSRARRIIFSALIGIVVIYGAFAIVSTFIAGQFPVS